MAHNKASKSNGKIENLLARMTLDEKISLLAGQDFWTLPAIDRLDIPSLRMSDGPTGLRSTNSEPATVFPVGTALAASFDPELVEEVGAAIAREAIAYEVDVLLAPGVNIQRTPLGGRNFEYMSEDPHLAGAIGTAYVTGVQGEGVGTSLKHFAANNQEYRRMDGSSDVAERTLREVYFPAFETVVAAAQPWTVMSAYNRLNGVFCSQNDWLLNTILKEEWQFSGVVVSDWTAAKETEGSANGGLDLEMPGPPKVYGAKLKHAIAQGDVDMSTIDDHVLRVLRLIERCGLLDGNPKSTRAELVSNKHRSLARSAASSAMVLLKNQDDILPLKSGQSIAVIGTLGGFGAIQGGGSSQVTPSSQISPLAGLTNAFDDDTPIVYERGVDTEPSAPPLDPALVCNDAGKQGLSARYYANAAFEGACVLEQTERWFSKLGFGDAAQTENDLAFSAEWTGVLRPRHSGMHEFEITHSNPDVWLEIGNESLVSETSPRTTEMLFMVLPLNRRTAAVELEAGKAYPVRIRYSQPDERSVRAFNIFNIALREPAPDPAKAIAAARDADIVIFVAGPGITAETEGEDRTSMQLPAEQNKMIEDLAATNSNLVVCLNCGGPLEMPWADKAKAIVQMWLPGQEGGAALADILTGKTNPSGKLPVTFPRRYEDNPSYLHYPGGSHVHYGEGLFVGYRHYDAMTLEPLFPFGHGLSYSAFELSDLCAPAKSNASADVRVRCKLANVGACAGAEVVQLYVEHCEATETMPVRQLRAFRKCALAAGAHDVIEWDLPKRAFAWFDVDAGEWTVTPGRFRLHVGTSSRDLPLSCDIELVA